MTDIIDKFDSLFSSNALTILDSMIYDASATYRYDVMSGGFFWSDEFPERNTPEWKEIQYNDVYRLLLAIRREITLGHMSYESHPLWAQVASEAPNWPGLHHERHRGRIVNRLKAAIRISNNKIDKLFGDSKGQADNWLV